MKRLWVALFVVFLGLSLSGCAAVRDLRLSDAIVDIEDINVDEYFAVLPITTSWEASDYEAGGYVAFIKKDGSFSLSKTGYIDMTSVVWEKEGVFFSDREHDYWLTSNAKNTINSSVKEALNHDSIIFVDGNYVSFYNWGFSDDGQGYEYEMIVGDKESVHRYVVPYAMHSQPVICGDRIVAVTQERFGMDTVSDGGVETTSEVREIHLDGTSAIITQQDGPIVEGEKLSVSGHSRVEYQCVNDNSLVGIVGAGSAEKGDGPFYFILEFWDLEMGERRAIPVTNARGEKIGADDGIEMQDMNGWFLDGNYFYVTLDQGVIARIDISDGVAILLNDPLEPFELSGQMEGGYASYFYETYSDGKIYQFVYNHDHEEEPYIRVMDVRTGKELEHIEVTGLNKAMTGWLSPSSFAVNPRV